MYNRGLIIIALFLGSMLLAGCATGVKFQGISPTAEKEEITLRGRLYKPKGEGPFPAVVFLHGCKGTDERQWIWANRLKDWGYAVLVVDSFGPRNIVDTCNRSHGPFTQAVDAHSARAFLAAKPFVDSNKIAVMGWSQGGGGTLFALKPDTLSAAKFAADSETLSATLEPFKAGIAFYPPCSTSLKNLSAPLLILIGGADDWTPADRCSSAIPKENTDHEVILKIYPGAHHCFDWPGKNVSAYGHRLKYSPKAAKDSIKQVKKFLDKYLQ